MSKFDQVVMSIEDTPMITERGMKGLCDALSKHTGQTVTFERGGGHITVLCDGNPNIVKLCLYAIEAVVEMAIGPELLEALYQRAKIDAISRMN